MEEVKLTKEQEILFEVYDKGVHYEDCDLDYYAKKIKQVLSIADVGSPFFISDLEKKLEIAKDEMASENRTTQLKATGKMLAYKGILDGIKNGYY